MALASSSLSAATITTTKQDKGERAAHPVTVFPLSFVENRGQWRDEVLFEACRGGVVASFLEDGFQLQVSAGEGHPRVRSIGLTFEGGCPGEVTGETTTTTVFSFLRGSSPKSGHSNIMAYESLLYRGLYPGVDVRIRQATIEGTSRQIEYDLHVEPGVGLETIVIRCDGVDAIQVDADGSLLMVAGSAAVRQPPPVCWQVLPSGGRRSVECRVVMLDACRFMFEVPGRDPALPLVIDPAIFFATYLGGAGEDFIFGMALDPAGVVVAGFTSSIEPLPGTVIGDAVYGAGRYDGFVARLDAGLRELRSFTFLGGSGEDRLLSVALTSEGDIVVTGQTSSPDFPTTANAAQTTYGGGVLDGFLTVLDPTGTAIKYSTYLGGPQEDSITSGIVDTLDRIIVAGFSLSPRFANWPGFPAPGGGFQELNRGASDIIVLRLNIGPDVPRDDQVEYCTFLGGSGNEAMGESDWDAWRIGDRISKPDLTLGEANTVLVSGGTESRDFPTTPGSYQPSYAGNWDAFVCHLSLDRESPPADQLLYSTFLGGNSTDAGQAISLDPSGNVWVSGFTFSAGFPTTPDAYSRSPQANDDVFLTRLRIDAAIPRAEQMVYSTLIGGSGWDFAEAHTVDGAGAITVVGNRMGVGDFPMTEGGGTEGFIAHFRPEGGDGKPPYELKYASSVGNMWTPMAIAKTSAGAYLVAGYMPGADLPSFEGSFQEQAGGDWESGIAMLNLSFPRACFAIEPESLSGEAPLDVHVDATCSETPAGTDIAAYQWDFGDGSTADVPTASHTYDEPGRHVIALTVVNDLGQAAEKRASVTATGRSTEMPPWVAADIGAPLFPGASWQEGADILVCAGGRTPAGASDEFHFVHQAFTGDFALTVHISDLMGWGLRATLGVMVRESLDPEARYAATFLVRAAGTTRNVLYYREEAGAQRRTRDGPVAEIAGWVRLERSGDGLVALSSTDGLIWLEFARQVIAGMPACVLVGLAANGADTGNATIPFTPLQARVSGLSLLGAGARSLRGEANGDGRVDLSDAVSILLWLFQGGEAPGCVAAADTNGDGGTDISDAVYLLGFLFLGGPPPPPPFPDCGRWSLPTDEGLGCAAPPTSCAQS